MPEVLPTLYISGDSFVLRWKRPSGCFDKYVLEVTYHGIEPAFKTLGDAFCAGTTILDPDRTNVTCDIIPACVNTSMVLRTQRNGPHGRTSRGEALHKYFDSAAPVDFDIYVETLNSSAAEIIIDAPNTWHCADSLCFGRLFGYNHRGLSAQFGGRGHVACVVVTAQNETPGPRSCGFVTRRKCEPGGTLHKFEDQTRDAAEAASKTAATFREEQEAATKAKPAADKATTGTTWSRATPPSRPTTVAQIENDDAEDMIHMRLMSSAGTPITISWSRQNDTIDFHKLVIMQDSTRNNTDAQTEILGSCVILNFKGPLERPNCPIVPACTDVVIMVGTYKFLPPELTFLNEDGSLSDMESLLLTSQADTSIMFSWRRPNYNFDFYFVQIMEDNVEKNASDRSQRLGSCIFFNGHYPRPKCPRIQACTYVSLKVRPGILSPPYITFPATRTPSLFLPGKDPDPPANISVLHWSSTLAFIEWNTPARVYGILSSYTVLTCKSFDTCDEEANATNCYKRVVNSTWMAVSNSFYRSLCVFVAANAVCGAHTYRSLEAVVEVIFTSFAAPGVRNLSLKSVGPDFFAISWAQPSVQFEYYWLEVYDVGDGSATTQDIGSCANGTIIHKDQTQVTCDKLRACANITITVHMKAKTDSNMTFRGTTLRGIFVPGQVLPEVTNLTLAALHNDSITVSWQRPQGCFGDYVIQLKEEKKRHNSGEPNLSVGSCGNATIIDATKTTVTCSNIEACSVSVTVRTRRTGSPDIMSHGVTLQGVVMYKKDLPTVQYTVRTLTDALYLQWAQPSGCFDKYKVDVSYESSNSIGPARYGTPFCAGTTILDPDQTSLSCANTPPCGYANVTVATQRDGPNGGTSRADVTTVELGKFATLDFDLHLESLTDTAANISVESRYTHQCTPGSCMAYIYDSTFYRKVRCLKVRQDDYIVVLTNLRSGSFYICSVYINNPSGLLGGIRTIGFRTL
ncbi:hypothetical protein MTO96_007676 [Rhipicephalus appendiculatus]